MKRDMDLVRDLLLLAEADGDDTELCSNDILTALLKSLISNNLG